jgi:hypothetical protein
MTLLSLKHFFYEVVVAFVVVVFVVVVVDGFTVGPIGEGLIAL